MKPHVQQALSRMGEVSIDDYYSLCGRLDTLEHIHEVLVAVAAQMMGNVEDEAPESSPSASVRTLNPPSATRRSSIPAPPSTGR